MGLSVSENRMTMAEKVKRKWRTVSLPAVLVERVEALVESGKYGYRNVPDFVTDAVRRLLREYGYLK
ncbi:hypothetical protein DRO24_05325 [Candidatus Bathyarchaeota archaeon]|nr:MAG: hypothetical protein DRO24_05325 [Candidatus Bathyarchaeota archaeon]